MTNIVAGSQSLVIVEFSDPTNNRDYLKTKEFLTDIMNVSIENLVRRCHQDCIILYKGSEYESWIEYMQL